MPREASPFLGSGQMCSWWRRLSFSIINCSEFRQEFCILRSLVLSFLLASTIICKILDLKQLNFLLMKKKMVLASLFQAPTGCWASCLVHCVYFDPYNHPGRKPCPSLFPDAEQGQRGEILVQNYVVGCRAGLKVRCPSLPRLRFFFPWCHNH